MSTAKRDTLFFMKKILKTYLLVTSLTFCIPVFSFAAKGETMNPPIIASDLSAYSNQDVIVFGLLSQVPHQHMMASGFEKTHTMAYFDLDQGDQTVMYYPASQEKSIKFCKGPLRLTAKVLEVKGQSKKPTDALPPKHAEEPGYSEHHLVVEQARCLSAQQPEFLLFELGLPSLSEAEKTQHINKIRKIGKLSIPDLILHLSDQRVFGIRTVIPGEAINAPNGAPIPDPIEAKLTVGQKAEELLYELITPIYDPPHRFQGKVFSETMFHVTDWEKWWKAHKKMTLEQIREQNKPQVDRYWQEHGSTQMIE